MIPPQDQARRTQLMTTTHVLASLERVTRSVGVPAPDIDGVVSATQRFALAALLRGSEDGRPTLEDGPDDAPPDTGVLLDDVRFVCWLHQVASRKAAWLARTAWVEQWYAMRDAAPRVATAVAQEMMVQGEEERAPEPSPRPHARQPAAALPSGAPQAAHAALAPPDPEDEERSRRAMRSLLFTLTLTVLTIAQSVWIVRLLG